MRDTENDIKLYTEFKRFLEDYFNGRLDDEINGIRETDSTQS